MEREEINQLKAELKYFTGSERYYQNPLFKNYVYTEGVQYLAEKAGAYWLIDYVLSNQFEPELKGQLFQVWKIETKPNHTAVITVEDDNKNLIKQFKLGFTDFPLEEFSLWLVDNTLLLSTEY